MADHLQWPYEPDLAKASDVEVEFTPQSDGSTRVDLEHGHFQRHGAGWNDMRAGVDSENGWGDLLKLFGAEIEKVSGAAAG